MKYIYALTDPRDNQVRYIGQTDDLAKRLQQHIADKSNSPKCTWIRELTTNRQYPGIVQLATVADEENAHYIEYRWIYFGRKNGWNLTNTTAMKSEEYYSLQGYFERLIVEMEKPADVPVKQYSGEDVKQELLALTVGGLKRLPLIDTRWATVSFSIMSTLIYALVTVKRMSSHEDMITAVFFIIALLGGISSLIANIGWANEPKEKFNYFGSLSMGMVFLGLSIAINFL